MFFGSSTNNDGESGGISNRAAAFLSLVKLSKDLADAETTIKLNPQWEKGYFRKGSVLEAMEKYEDALAAFEMALLYNPQSAEHLESIKSEMAFESPHTHTDSISYPQVWKGQGSRKWKLGQNDGIFVQFESPWIRNVWFIPSSKEKGQPLCRDPQALDIGAHEILPRIFKEVS
ncbi:hypothetical protein AALP_AAs63180U000300 [Arabis alpina]|uniref:Uncharacterized protein n=1 Tax=Arabis alpina TaxID=50452 RepID=A0A087G087_ARAAL|nr:hypothetical protein AALP_AAs63180U000300 [Arabis alpina]